MGAHFLSFGGWTESKAAPGVLAQPEPQDNGHVTSVVMVTGLVKIVVAFGKQ